jgi:hypothetical protein
MPDVDDGSARPAPYGEKLGYRFFRVRVVSWAVGWMAGLIYCLSYVDDK